MKHNNPLRYTALRLLYFIRYRKAVRMDIRLVCILKRRFGEWLRYVVSSSVVQFREKEKLWEMFLVKVVKYGLPLGGDRRPC